MMMVMEVKNIIAGDGGERADGEDGDDGDDAEDDDADVDNAADEGGDVAGTVGDHAQDDE